MTRLKSTTVERFASASRCAEMIRAMIAEELRKRNPQWPEMRVRHALASIWLSDALKDEVIWAEDIFAEKPEVRQRLVAAIFGERSLRDCPDRM